MSFFDNLSKTKGTPPSNNAPATSVGNGGNFDFSSFMGGGAGMSGLDLSSVSRMFDGTATGGDYGAAAGAGIGAAFGVPPQVGAQIGKMLGDLGGQLFGDTGGGNKNDGKHKYFEEWAYFKGGKNYGSSGVKLLDTNPNWYNGTWERGLKEQHPNLTGGKATAYFDWALKNKPNLFVKYSGRNLNSSDWFNFWTEIIDGFNTAAVVGAVNDHKQYYNANKKESVNDSTKSNNIVPIIIGAFVVLILFIKK